MTVPSGISSVLMSLQTVPYRQRSSSTGSSTETSICGMATSQLSPSSTSETSLMDFSRPTVMGNTVPGNMTALRSVSTGSTGGSCEVSTFREAASPITGIMFTSTPAGAENSRFCFILLTFCHIKGTYCTGGLYRQSLCHALAMTKFHPNILNSEKLTLFLRSFSEKLNIKTIKT